jgi:hypothetical protein
MDAQTHIANIHKAVEFRIDTQFPEIPADVAKFLGLAAMSSDELIVKKIQVTQAAKRLFNEWNVRTANDRRQRDSLIGDCVYDIIAIERHIDGRK